MFFQFTKNWFEQNRKIFVLNNKLIYDEYEALHPLMRDTEARADPSCTRDVGATTRISLKLVSSKAGGEDTTTNEPVKRHNSPQTHVINSRILTRGATPTPSPMRQ